MMSEILKSILLMSAAGGMLALLLLCIKPITRKYFSPTWQYYIWLTVLIVMVIPIQFSIPAKQADIPSVNTAVQTEQNITMQADTENVQMPVLNERSEKPAVKIPEIPINIVHILGFIWLAAALLILGYKLTKYAVFLRAICKNAVPCTMENIPARLAVRKTDLLDAPLIVGLIRPVLYLPQGEIKQEELEYILLHELTHYKRYDVLYKWFTMLVASVHWFNPFVYIVSKQIDEECEVSCDYTVCKKLTEPQKNSYMTMILDFVGASIRQKRPLTTQMASSKKTLTRRFMMIKNKKQAGKFVSVLSAILTFVILSTTVFASSVLSDLTTDDYRIEILNHSGEKIELVNKPFIENGVVYVPLRETFEKAGVMDNEISYINWDNGKIEMNITHDNESIAYYLLEIGKNDIQLRHIKPNETVSRDLIQMNVILQPNNAFHKLKGNITYVSLENANYMLYGFLNIRDENKKLRELTYTVYDKNGNVIDISYNLSVGTIILNSDGTVVYNGENLKNPQSTINGFFEAFSDGDFALMKNYCTEKCRNDFFGDGYCFGMTKAELTLVRTDELYTNSSNDVNALVSVNMTPHENSVFDKSQTSASFYVILERQPDGRYLIDEFATGL